MVSEEDIFKRDRGVTEDSLKIDVAHFSQILTIGFAFGQANTTGAI